MREKPIISIDGPSYCGKSTISKELSRRLGFKHINTGAYYRVVAWKMLEKGLDESNVQEIIKIANKLKVEFKCRDNNILVDGVEVTHEIYSPDVTHFTSIIATIKDLRESLVSIQRNAGKGGGIIVEGRDVATVIFPDAEWKFFVYADFEIRVKRFYKVCREKKMEIALEDCAKRLKEIDYLDTTREEAPLKKNEDSILYNNSNSPSEYQDAIILEYYINNYPEIIKNSACLKKRYQA